MYRGFNLNIDKSFFSSYDFEIGKKNYSKTKKDLKDNISTYMYEDSTLDGTKILEEWFPNIKVNVFISHSHTDEKLAIKLAGWLDRNFGLKSFIDSCVWGYADDLLLNIDNRYCYNKDTRNYRYKDRNFSTSHVHMMLSTALNSMIDEAECIIFLNTENSIQTVKEVIDETTMSPWIYSELETTRIIRKKPLDYYRKGLNKIALFEQHEIEIRDRLTIRYRCKLNHLCDIDYKALENWKEMNKALRHQHALDNLYCIIPEKEESK